ncbi:MAG: hypothetical protein M0Z93_10435, partial [Actinomycetota bacterium]|nr:hypothetical protein [Actinomycetota bacterium]
MTIARHADPARDGWRALSVAARTTAAPTAITHSLATNHVAANVIVPRHHSISRSHDDVLEPPAWCTAH